jgi:hypothetical protein
MNQSYPYPIPGSQGNPNAFVADNTGVLGDVDQPLDGRTLVSVDYSQLTPGVTLTSYSFRITPGGEPQLWISGAILGNPATGLSFYISGGIGGQQYQVTIIVILGDTERRSDVLNVNLLGDGCSCSLPMPTAWPQDATSSDGSIIVNTAPRFFVSATAPVAPNVLDRWYDTTNGVVLDYISNGLFSSWVVPGGGSGGGGGTGGSSTIRRINPITPDGTKVSFNLTAIDGTTVTIAADAYLFVSLDGVWQEPTYQYSAAGNIVVFAQAPTADAKIFMLWFSGA